MEYKFSVEYKIQLIIRKIQDDFQLQGNTFCNRIPVLLLVSQENSMQISYSINISIQIV
jgi:hypothetical protein